MTIFIRLLAFLAPFRMRVALAILLGCVTVASNMGLLGMAAYLIAAAALKPLLILLTLPIYMVRFMGVSRAVARYAERLVAHDVTFRLLSELRARVYARLAPLAPARLLAYRSGDVLARLVGDIEELQNLYLGVVAPLVVAVAIAALTYNLFALFSRTLAWAALAFLAAAGAGVPLLAGALSRGLGQRRLTARAALNTEIVDGLQGMQDLLACGRPDVYRRKVAALDGALARVQRRVALIGGARQASNDLLMNLALWTLLVLTIPLVTARAIDGVYLGLLALVILASFEAVQPLGAAFQSLGRSLAAGARVFEVIDAAPSVTDPAAPLPAPISPGLDFDGVSFSYSEDDDVALDGADGVALDGADGVALDGADGVALRGITFSLRPGRRVAIVGPSGAGKSTLARLAVRAWDPASGAIRLGGADIRRYRLDDLRAAVGVVAQDTYIFNDTVRGNLLLARPDASDDELARAVELAQLAEFVRDLPDGLDTWVGEQGLRLSGGERQRLAIARALLKDAPLLILDEATANLDPITERAALDALDALMRGRTVLLITHRLVAMERMDEILALDRGRIVERGTHDELLAAHGLYRRLVDTQDGLVDAA